MFGDTTRARTFPLGNQILSNHIKFRTKMDKKFAPIFTTTNSRLSTRFKMRIKDVMFTLVTQGLTATPIYSRTWPFAKRT